MRQKSDTVALFEEFLADESVTGTPSAVKVVHSDKGGKFQGDLAKLCRRYSIRQEFTNTDDAILNGVAKRHIAMV